MLSRTVDLDGPVHYLDFGGNGPAFVLVHGLGGSHPNWLAVGPGLAEHGRTLAPDLVGFGRTPPAGRPMTLGGHLTLLESFLGNVVGGPAILVGNSTGGALSVLLAATRPDLAAGLVLVNPALPVRPRYPSDPLVIKAFAAYGLPGFGASFIRRHRDRLGPEGMVRETLELCCSDVNRVPADVFDAHVAFARERFEMPWADEAFLKTARSLMRFIFNRPQYHKTVRQITAPTLHIHGAADRLVRIGSARQFARIRPDWTFVSIKGVGHVPMLEAPDRFLEAVSTWLAGRGRAALLAAMPEPGRRASAARA
ncbi:MAG: alpha/beta fold hydrolase [Actinomycetota bacterium]